MDNSDVAIMGGWVWNSVVCQWRLVEKQNNMIGSWSSEHSSNCSNIYPEVSSQGKVVDQKELSYNTQVKKVPVNTRVFASTVLVNRPSHFSSRYNKYILQGFKAYCWGAENCQLVYLDFWCNKYYLTRTEDVLVKRKRSVF